MKNEMVHDPFLVDSVKRRSSNGSTSHPWMRRALLGCLGSVFCLIILTILLALPITVLIIGTRYRDPRYCPIQPRISLFLIVNGGVTLGWIILTILMWVITAFSVHRRSSMSAVLATILYVLLFLSSIFSTIWLIIGSVWTFSVRNRVIHDYDRINHFYLYTYCHPVLYEFTFIYLIISYVLIAIQCCHQCITCAFGSSRNT